MTIIRRRSIVLLAVAAFALAGSSWAPAAAAPQRQAGSAGTGAAATGSDWPQFGFSAARTSENPLETVLGPGNIAGIQQQWSFLAANRIFSSPAVVSGVVYFTDSDSHLYAVNAATGTQLWSFGLTNAFFSSDPAVAGGIVYVGSVDGHLYAVNAATGTQLWSFATPGQANYDPAVDNGVVYIESKFGAPTGGGAVYALDAATGALLWSFSTPGSPTGLAVDNGVVYEVTSDEDGLLGSAYALSAATGQMLWHFASPGPLYTPVVAGGVVYAGFQDETTKSGLLALRASNGKPKWLTQVGISQSPAVANGLVYVGNGYGFVDAYSATSGKLAWQFRVPPSDPTSNVSATPVVANGIVYDSAGDGTLYALGATTGQELASVHLGTATNSPATVADGAIYVGNYDQHLYALALPASAP